MSQESQESQGEAGRFCYAYVMICYMSVMICYMSVMSEFPLAVSASTGSFAGLGKIIFSNVNAR